MDKKQLISIIRKSKYSFFLQYIYNKLFPIRGKNNIIIGGNLFYKKYIRIVGNNNIIEFKKKSFLRKIPITVLGNDNHIIIGENVKFLGGNILCDGSKCIIEIGKGTSIQWAHINAQERNTVIKIGENCMFSLDVMIRTSDSHTIYDVNTKQRINDAKSVFIGNHVWLGISAYILKGVTIGDNCIIGIGSIVTHDIPSNSLAVGAPAKVIRKDVNWNNKLMRVYQD